MTKLLITVDDSALSHTILPVATKVAREMKATIVLLTVVAPVSQRGPGPDVREAIIGGQLENAQFLPAARTGSRAGGSLTGSLANQTLDGLENLAMPLRNEGIDVEAAVMVENEPARAIINFARRENVDIVAMATHGRSGLSSLVQGSVASAVLRSGVAPVLLVRPQS